MASSTAKSVGITGPLSTALPTEEENKMSQSLVEELRRQNTYESQSETHRRYAHGDLLSYSCAKPAQSPFLVISLTLVL
jgi:poly(A) polymerase Pap1